MFNVILVYPNKSIRYTFFKLDEKVLTSSPKFQHPKDKSEKQKLDNFYKQNEYKYANERHFLQIYDELSNLEQGLSNFQEVKITTNPEYY